MIRSKSLHLTYVVLLASVSILFAHTLTDLPLLMDATLITGLVAVRLYWSHDEPVPDVRYVWNAGAILVVVGLLYAPLRTFLGYPLAAVAVTLWLGSRFSTMPRQWLKVAARNLTDEVYASSSLNTDIANPTQAAFLPGGGRSDYGGVEFRF